MRHGRVGEEELWVCRESRADDECRKWFVNMMKARETEKATTRCNGKEAVVPFEVIDGAFPDFKQAKGIAVGHVIRKGHGIRESVTGPKGKKPGKSNNCQANGSLGAALKVHLNSS